MGDPDELGRDTDVPREELLLRLVVVADSNLRHDLCAAQNGDALSRIDRRGGGELESGLGQVEQRGPGGRGEDHDFRARREPHGQAVEVDDGMLYVVLAHDPGVVDRDPGPAAELAGEHAVEPHRRLGVPHAARHGSAWVRAAARRLVR